MLLETFHTVGARCRLNEHRHIEPLEAMMAEPRQRDPQVFRQLTRLSAEGGTRHGITARTASRRCSLYDSESDSSMLSQGARCVWLQPVLAAAKKCIKITGLKKLFAVAMNLVMVRPSGPSMPPYSPP